MPFKKLFEAAEVGRISHLACYPSHLACLQKRFGKEPGKINLLHNLLVLSLISDACEQGRSSSHSVACGYDPKRPLQRCAPCVDPCAAPAQANWMIRQHNMEDGDTIDAHLQQVCAPSSQYAHAKSDAKHPPSLVALGCCSLFSAVCKISVLYHPGYSVVSHSCVIICFATSPSPRACPSSTGILDTFCTASVQRPRSTCGPVRVEVVLRPHSSPEHVAIFTPST